MNELTERCESFAIDILTCCKSMEYNTITRPIIGQLIRSATSIGANYTEAQMAISKKDFRAKVFIAKKECAETAYWLRLLGALETVEQVTIFQKECGELLAIFQTITNKTKPSNT